MLLEINNALVANLDRQPLFDTIAQAIRRIIPFDRLNITLYNAEKDVFTNCALVGPAVGSFSEVPGRAGRLGQVLLRTKRPYLIRDIAAVASSSVDSHVHAAVLKAGLRSSVILPLFSKRRPIGTLNLSSYQVGQYSTEDADFLFEVGKQVALAVDNMLAYEEIARLKIQLEQENVYLKEALEGEHDFGEIVGQSPAVQHILRIVEMGAPTPVNVLLLGETGTGKELVARALHNLSPRREKPLVKVNCAVLPANLFESELFGHVKGAFTGAVADRAGRFEQADGGTLFLDEVGDLPLDLQAKLLRVLQEGEFERLGDTCSRRVDVRVIAATNRDLEREVQEERFRQDLFYRLNVFPIHLPSLRQRRGDIPLLVAHLVAKHAGRLGKSIEYIPQKTMKALQAYPWPGNVRELENIIERGIILGRGTHLALGDWLPVKDRPAHQSLKEIERQHILSILKLTDGRVSGTQGAAEILGLKRTTLESKIKKLDIRRPY